MRAIKKPQLVGSSGAGGTIDHEEGNTEHFKKVRP